MNNSFTLSMALIRWSTFSCAKMLSCLSQAHVLPATHIKIKMEAFASIFYYGCCLYRVGIFYDCFNYARALAVLISSFQRK
jgi:hypothetical protein